GGGAGGRGAAPHDVSRPGTKVLAAATGKFGERWIQLAESFGADLVKHEPGWGVRLDPADFDRLLSERPAEVVFATLSGPSTGMVHDVAAIAEGTRRHDAILVIDAVSGLGAAEL